MFGILIALIWLGLTLWLSVAWESTGNSPKLVKTGEKTATIEFNAPIRGRVRNRLLLAIGIGLTPFWAVFGANCFLTIPPASIAAVYDPLRGGIQQSVLPEGFHIVMPWWETRQFTQQTQEYTMSATRSEGAVLGDDSIRCQTNEGMNVEIDCTVLFHVDPKAAHNVWSKLGEDVVRLIVRPYTHNVMRMVVAKYSVEDVYTTRRKQIEQEIISEMKPQFAEKGIVLEQVLLRNVQYGNPAFADSINEKQVAQQDVQTEQQKLSRAKIQKETVIAQARGEAESISKRGATLRENPEVVQYEFVQKIAPRLKSMYLPANSLPIVSGKP